LGIELDAPQHCGDQVNESRAMPHAPEPPPGSASLPRFVVLKRALLAAATAFLAINLWTGAPLFALWVGSRVVGRARLTIGAVFVVVVVLGVLVFAMALALVKLNAAYDRLIGRPTRERRLTWLRSVRAEGRSELDQARQITALESVIMITVWAAVIALLVWFFFFAGSPLAH
jgi:hypothetical protein